MASFSYLGIVLPGDDDVAAVIPADKFSSATLWRIISET
jgi:hypothetical protein